MNPDLLKMRTNQWLFALGRLKPDVTIEQARASLSALQTSLDPPDGPRPDPNTPRINVTPVSDGPPGQRDQLVPVAWLVTSVVGMVLIASGLFVRSLRETQRIESGYDVQRLMTLGLPINLLRFTRDQGREFYGRAIERAASLPSHSVHAPRAEP